MFERIKTMGSSVGSKIVGVKDSAVKTWNDASITKKVIVGATAVAVVAGAIFVAMDRAKISAVSNDVDDLGNLDMDLASLDMGMDMVGDAI